MNTFINISGLFKEESWILPGARILDLEHIQGSCCYCDPEAEEAIREALQPFPAGGVHWIDSGDYHYLSKLWMEKISEPFALSLFDNHPDDQLTAFGSILSCGSWVRSAREGLPFMKADYLNTADIPGCLPLYLSIDLDYLSRDYARTDWDQGTASLDELLQKLSVLCSGHRIIAVDICGGITQAKGARAEDYRINVRTRSALAEFFRKWEV